MLSSFNLISLALSIISTGYSNASLSLPWVALILTVYFPTFNLPKFAYILCPGIPDFSNFLFNSFISTVYLTLSFLLSGARDVALITKSSLDLTNDGALDSIDSGKVEDIFVLLAPTLPSLVLACTVTLKLVIESFNLICLF